jgi:peptidoglycan/LPS O-acetylase OafA/YrhL
MGSLRFSLSLTVLFTHAIGGGLIGGRYAVECFFVISGYLISYILIESKNYNQKRNFYINRALRLLPLYYVVILVSFPLYFIAHYLFQENNQFAAYSQMPLTIKFLLGITNLMILGQDQLFFLSLNGNTLSWGGNFTNSEIELYRGLLAPPSWTLSIEILFYLIAPLVLSHKKLIFFLLSLSISLRILFIWAGFGLSDPWVYRFFPTELMFFLLGALSNQIWSPYTSIIKVQFYNFLKKCSMWVWIVYFLAFPYWKSNFILRDIMLFVLILLVLPFISEIQRKSKLDNFLGQLSYPIYLWHPLIIIFVGGLSEKLNSNELIRIILILAVTFIVSWASLILLEYKIERLRSKFKLQKLGF